MRILIVEDSEPVRRMIKSFIADLADDFIECGRGDAALDAFTRHRPDLVLMDIKTKGTSGLETTSRIKAAFPEARVIIISQWEGPVLREAARGAGAEELIGKTNLLPLRHLLEAARRKDGAG